MRLSLILLCLLWLLLGCGEPAPASPPESTAPPSEPVVDYSDPAGPFYGYTSLEDDAEEWSIVGVKDRNVLTIRPGKSGARTDHPGLSKYGLKEAIKWFAINPVRMEDLADSTRNALIILADRRSGDTTWRASTYDSIRLAYTELWDGEGEKRYGQRYVELPRNLKEKIIAELPIQVYAAGPWIIPPPPPPPPPPVIEKMRGG